MKEPIIQELQLIIRQKLTDLSNTAQSHQEALSQASKSSAGDKHETSRAMIHLEQEKLAGQLNTYKKQLSFLDSLQTNKPKYLIENGTYVQTDKNRFFICIAHGKLILNNQVILAISPRAPIAQEMIGKKVNDQFSFNGIIHTILSLS